MILTPSCSLASHSSKSPFNRNPYLQHIDSLYQLSKFSIISFPTNNSFQLHPIKTMAQTNNSCSTAVSGTGRAMNSLLFVEMGVGYDQHGGLLKASSERLAGQILITQDITAAAMRACRDAISSNSIPAFRRGSIPGVSSEQMKLQIKLGVPQSLQQLLDTEKIKSVFPYGEIVKVEVVDGGLICSSGVHVEEMGDKNDDCYIVNAAVYVGY